MYSFGEVREVPHGAGETRIPGTCGSVWECVNNPRRLPSSCLEHAVGSGSRAPDRAGDPNRRHGPPNSLAGLSLRVPIALPGRFQGATRAPVNLCRNCRNRRLTRVFTFRTSPKIYMDFSEFFSGFSRTFPGFFWG